MALKYIVDINKGRQHTSVFSTNGNGKKRYIQIDDLRNDFNLKYTDQTGVEVFPNDLIIAWDGANAGTIGFNLTGYIGSTLARLRIRQNEFDAKFLGWYLRSKSKDLRQNCTGATIPHISKSYLESIEIPKIDLPTQKQIAQLLEDADVARQKRKAANALTDQFLQSSFLSMFGDLMENDKNWKSEILDSLVVGGFQNGLYVPNTKYGKGIPILRIDSFYDGFVDNIHNLKRVEIDSKTINLYSLKENDIVINRVNSRKYLGKSAIIPALEEPSVFESNMMRFSVDCQRLVPLFLIYQLQQPHIRHQILKSAKDAVNQSSINQEDVKSFKIYIPPLSLQQKFASIVADTEQLRQKQKQSETELENLFQALLQKYFG